MKSVIFSIYISINETNLQPLEGYFGDSMSRSQRTKFQLAKYYNRLVDCKQKYAEICNADYIVYTNDQEYQKFIQTKSLEGIKEFDKINFYKIYLLEKLSKLYDHVLYLDLDVVPSTTQSFFAVNDVSKFCIHCVPATKENTWGTLTAQFNRSKHCKEHNCKYTYDHIVEEHLDSYHWYIKKLCKDAMLIHHGLSDPLHMLANTAIMGGSADAIHQLKFFNRLNEMLDTYNEIKQEKIMGPAITDKFFINNEVLMTYLIIKYQLDVFYLPGKWHYVQLDIYKNLCSKSEAKFIHVVDKKFEKIWQENV